MTQLNQEELFKLLYAIEEYIIKNKNVLLLSFDDYIKQIKEDSWVRKLNTFICLDDFMPFPVFFFENGIDNKDKIWRNFGRDFKLLTTNRIYISSLMVDDLQLTPKFSFDNFSNVRYMNNIVFDLSTNRLKTDQILYINIDDTNSDTAYEVSLANNTCRLV